MPSEIYMLSFLGVLASLVLVIASLYWAKAVLVPLALALMLTFLLQPDRGGAPPPGSRSRASSGAGRHAARARARSRRLGRDHAILQPDVRAAALSR